MPTYLLARDPAVILPAAIAALELVLVPNKVFAGRLSSSAMPERTEVETFRVVVRPGVAVDGRGRLEGVIRPLNEYEA